MGRQNLDAHLGRNRLAIILANRAIEHAAQMGVVLDEVTAIEIAQFGNLLRYFKRGHRAHFEIAALKRRHFGALLEQGRCGMHADIKSNRCGINVGLELLQCLGKKITRRRGR